MKKIGLIAGNRDLPIIFAQNAKSQNPELSIYIAALKGDTKKQIEQYAEQVCWIFPGQIEKSIEFFRAHEVEELIFLGQVSPASAFLTCHKWDATMRNAAEKSQGFRPHAIFSKILQAYESAGFKVLDSTTCMESTIAKLGVNNSVELASDIKEEIEKALERTKKIVDLDIGQTVIIKDNTVLAVEAFEGTDNCIKRGAKIAHGNFIMLKRAMNNQDMRFDVPVIGLKTIKLLKKLKAKALVIHAEKTFILEKEKVFELANKAGIPIVGYE